MQSILIYLFLTLSVNGVADTPRFLVSNEFLDVIVEDDFYKEAHYDYKTSLLTFVTTDQISVIKILDENDDVEFQLPVKSTRLKLNKNLFVYGYYRLEFVLANGNDVKYADLFLK